MGFLSQGYGFSQPGVEALRADQSTKEAKLSQVETQFSALPQFGMARQLARTLWSSATSPSCSLSPAFYAHVVVSWWNSH